MYFIKIEKLNNEVIILNLSTLASIRIARDEEKDQQYIVFQASDGGAWEFSHDNLTQIAFTELLNKVSYHLKYV